MPYHIYLFSYYICYKFNQIVCRPKLNENGTGTCFSRENLLYYVYNRLTFVSPSNTKTLYAVIVFNRLIKSNLQFSFLPPCGCLSSLSHFLPPTILRTDFIRMYIYIPSHTNYFYLPLRKYFYCRYCWQGTYVLLVASTFWYCFCNVLKMKTTTL